MNTNQCIDPDGNVIRRGMSVVYENETWVVQVCRPRRIELARKKPNGLTVIAYIWDTPLRMIHVIGFQMPQVCRSEDNWGQPGIY